MQGGMEAIYDDVPGAVGFLRFACRLQRGASVCLARAHRISRAMVAIQ